MLKKIYFWEIKKKKIQASKCHHVSSCHHDTYIGCGQNSAAFLQLLKFSEIQTKTLIKWKVKCAIIENLASVGSRKASLRFILKKSVKVSQYARTSRNVKKDVPRTARDLQQNMNADFKRNVPLVTKLTDRPKNRMS